MKLGIAERAFHAHLKLAREAPRQQPVRIVIYVPSVDPDMDVAGACEVTSPLREREQATVMRELFRVGRRAMVIGLAIYSQGAI